MQFIVVCPVQGGKLFFLEHVKSPREFYVVRSIQTLLSAQCSVEAAAQWL